MNEPVSLPKQILVIIDKPKHEQTALQRALALQERAGAHLHLAAFAYHPMYDQKDVFDVHQRRAIKKEIVRERTEWLRHLVRDAHGMFRDLTLEVAWTKGIARWVARRVAEHGDELVVKGIHQSQTLLHTPLDWQLLRLCPSPLLLCTARPWQRKPRVLAALDLRESDEAHEVLNRAVLEAAQQACRLYGAELHCVYALDVPKVLSQLNLPDPRSFQREAAARARKRLQELTAGYGVSDG